MMSFSSIFSIRSKIFDKQDKFKAAYEEILKERESEAKLIRAREAREKAEKASIFY